MLSKKPGLPKFTLLANLQTVAYWVMNLFMFRPAEIIGFDTDQCLLFEGTACKVAWKTRGAYRVKLFLNDKFHSSYKPNAIAELPVHGGFQIELIAQSIYGNTRQSL